MRDEVRVGRLEKSRLIPPTPNQLFSDVGSVSRDSQHGLLPLQRVSPFAGICTSDNSRPLLVGEVSRFLGRVARHNRRATILFVLAEVHMSTRGSKQAIAVAETTVRSGDIGASAEDLLRQRAHTTMGFCAVSVIAVGKLSRVIVSYDPDQALKLMHCALGNDISGDPPGPILTDPRDWFSLSPEQAHRILVAPDLPIVPLDWNSIRDIGKPSRFTPEEVYGYSIATIALLLNELHVSHIYPLSAARPPVGHAEKLAKASRRFRDILNDKATDRLVSDWPELKKFRSLTTDLTLIANMTADARQAEAKRTRGDANARQTFVREKLAECFEGLYGRKAGASRPSSTGEAGGPFVRFATTFFAEIGLPVAAETIARDLRRRPKKAQAASA